MNKIDNNQSINKESNDIIGKYYFIFGLNTLKNKGISKILSLKINELLKRKNIEEYIIIDLHDSLSNDDIYSYVTGVSSIAIEPEKIIFIALEIEKDEPIRSKSNIDKIGINNLYYINDFLANINTLKGNSQNQ